MRSRIAVLLQTCNRPDYTRRTLETWHAHNAGAPFLLLHGDDASTDAEGMRTLAGAYGFETVVQSQERVGVIATQRALLLAATRRKADWVLVLENDIETLRPFPWALFRFVERTPDIYCLRLFGRYKDEAKRVACKTTHSWRKNEPVEWRPLRDAPEKAQVGCIHWTSQPAVTRTSEALSIHAGCRPDAWTARVKKNVVSHIGHECTPGRIV